MRFGEHFLVMVLLTITACGSGSICDVTAADLAGTYELAVTRDGEPDRTLQLTFTESGVDIIQVGRNDEFHCVTGTTAFCALDIRCTDENGRPQFRFLWSGD